MQNREESLRVGQLGRRTRVGYYLRTMSKTSAGIRPYYFLVAWLLLNLIQAAFTPLDPDETYYWMYAGRLDWGYFDHPPAVALLISIGRDWIPGALGLRFGHVLAGSGTITAIYFLLDRPRGSALWLLAALVFAQPMLQVYGFIATPDGPLVLFTVLYLLAYRQFLSRSSMVNALILGLTMAGLLYSKYHGLMLILFTVLPNLGFLIRKPSAWLAGLSGALLFAPHLYWQYLNDYPSFRYHLSGRDDPYQFKYTVQYLVNQLLIFSPFLVYHYLRSFIKDHARDRFERSLRWLAAGMLLFFLYTTTKGRTEAQWTALLSVPLVYLTFQAVRRFPGWRPALVRLCWLTGGILLLARIILILPSDWLPFEKPFDHEPWVHRLEAIAGDSPVIVENSYRFASLYEFYTGGKPGWTFTDVAYRPSQYDLWKRDTQYHNDAVYLLGQRNWDFFDTDTFHTQKGEMRLRKIDRFQVVKDVALEVEFSGADDPTIKVYATSPRSINLSGQLPVHLFIINGLEDGTYAYERLPDIATDRLPDGRRVLLFSGIPPDSFVSPDGEKNLSVGLGYQGMPPLRGQSPTYELE